MVNVIEFKTKAKPLNIRVAYLDVGKSLDALKAVILSSGTKATTISITLHDENQVEEEWLKEQHDHIHCGVCGRVEGEEFVASTKPID